MKLYKNKEWLEEQYIIKKKPMAEIEKMYNYSDGTIKYWLKKHHIPIRSKSEARKGIQFSEEHKKHLSEARLKRKQELGYINSPEARRKMSESQLKRKERDGYINSPETRKKLSEVMKGKTPWNKGKIGVYSPETLKQKSEARKGIQFSEEHKKHLSEARKDKPLTDLHKQHISDSLIGKPKSEQHRKKHTGENNYMYGKGYLITGDKNPNWNPNREEVYTPYGGNFYDNQLRNERWNLQNRRDLLTGEKLDWGFKSKYHHLDWNKSNDDPDNHIWVNASTHGKVHTKRKRKYYEFILKNNLQTLKEGKIPKNWKAKNKEMFRQEKLIQLELPINQIIKKECGVMDIKIICLGV